MPKWGGAFGILCAVEASRTKIRRTQTAIETAFAAKPSVPNWCRMCKFVAEYVFIATQLRDGHFFEDKYFRMGIGFLLLPPKRIPSGQIVNDEEWDEMQYYTAGECQSMTESFEYLDLRLAEWAISQNGDEQGEAQSAEERLAQEIWRFRTNVEKGSVAIFKSPLGKQMFRSYPLEVLSKLMPKKAILPREDVSYLPIMSDPESEYRERSLDLQERTCRGIERMVSDAASDGQARARVGTAGEVAQENEVLGRVRANGDKGLRGFVAQVLREAKWQFADGHPNTDVGRQRCYNRVYALMNPLRRSKRRRGEG